MSYFKRSEKESRKDLLEDKNEYDSAAWLGQMKLYKRLCKDKRRDYWNNKNRDSKIKRLTFELH